jgi:hypothetical protein
MVELAKAYTQESISSEKLARRLTEKVLVTQVSIVLFRR